MAIRLAYLISFLFLFLYGIFAFLGIGISLEPGMEIGGVSRWCERVSDSIFREPVNTITNLAFMVTGLIMFHVLNRDEENVNTFHTLTPIAILYASAAIFLGPGSFLMHGTHTEWGGWADNLSMVMYIVIPWLYNFKVMAKWSTNTFFKVYFSIIVAYGLGRWFLGDGMGIGFSVYGVSIGVWIVSEFLFKYWSQRMRFLSGFMGFLVAAIFGIYPQEIFSNLDQYWWILFFWLPGIVCNKKPEYERKHFPWFFIGMFLYISAFVIWLQGYPNQPLCNPDSLIQPHGIWHILCSLATLSFFIFLRTENVKKRGD
tara:strand:- start:9 stop:950 length:942 start_codon:yes stop_codon:yes gene_type:complete